MLYKQFSFKVKDFDGKGKFSGMLATNGNIDQGLDRFLPGTWKKTLNDRGGKQYPMLWVHNQKNAVGTFVGKDIPEGLLIEGKLKLDLIPPLLNGDGNRIDGIGGTVPMVPDAWKVYALYKGGDLDGLSVGWEPIKTEYTTESPFNDGIDYKIRNISESRLWEGSFAPIPMNEQAALGEMKSMDGVIAFLIKNLSDKDLKYKIFSLYNVEPQLLDTLMENKEPESKSTPQEIEPEDNILTKIYTKLNGG